MMCQNHVNLFVYQLLPENAGYWLLLTNTGTAEISDLRELWSW